MRNDHLKILLKSILAGLLLNGAVGLASQKPSQGTKSDAGQPAVGPQPTVAAAPKATITPSLEEMPALPPQVSFDAGELTIVARNSSLGAILQEVQTKTGANIDMPEPPTDRVVGQFGPGTAREVLTALLNGSHFNYVLLGSSSNPSSLDKVVLLSKAAPDQSSATQAPGAVLPQRQAITPPSQDPDDMNAQDSNDDMVQPDATPTAEQQPDPASGQPNAQPAVKTPQQLLQELQRQQQVQQQPGANGPPQQIQQQK